MAKLRGGTTIGGNLATHFGNFKNTLSVSTDIALTGDVTGTGNFDATGTLSIATVVGNDSHTHAASALTGTTLAAGVTASSLTSVGTITSGVWNGTAIANTYLSNSSTTIGTTAIALGASSLTLAGLTSVAATTFTGALTGNATTATTLKTARTISLAGDVTGSVSFNGGANVSITATVGNDSHLHSWNNLTDQPGQTAFSADIVSTAVNQTTFTVPGGYTPGYVVVFLNGVVLSEADYTASNGTTIVLTTGVYEIGEMLRVLVYGTFGIPTATDPTIIMNAVKTIDGAGSGLDADLFDGIESANFVYGQNVSGSNGANVTQTLTELPQYKSGFWDVNAAAWTPTTGWYWGLTMAHTSNSPTYNYGAQLAVLNGSSAGMYVRTISGGATPTASAWSKVWNEANDGAGSGLDADTVDGLQVHTGTNNVANQIVRTDASGYLNAGWINTISGTATGTLTRIYCSQDGYLRYLSPSALVTSIGGTSSTTFAIGNHTHTFDSLTSKGSGTGDYATTGNIASGKGSGGVALTINDGYGNANVTFNHEDGVPEQAGNAGRIEVNTDSSTGASMNFELKSGVTTTAVQTTTVMTLTEGKVDVTGNITLSGTVDGRDVATDGTNQDNHIASTSNPHSVTKSQVGLSNVNNTSDAAKPVSTAQQTALDLKLNLTGGTISGALTVNGNTTLGNASTDTVTVAGPLIMDELRTKNGNQLIINAGESHTVATGQTGESVYVNAEGGLVVSSSPDNWATAWAGRKTATINNSAGASSFPGDVTVGGDIYATGTKIEGDAKEMFRFSDGWLRINPANEFTSGIYCNTGILRTDGNLQVGSAGASFNVTAAGAVSAAGTITGSNLSGTNTGDQTTITGNAGSATVLATARNINGVSFNGSANITVADSTKLPLAGGSMTGKLLVKKDGVVSPSYSNGQLELQTMDGNDVSMGFHRGGFTACQLRHSSNGLILSGTTRTNAADFYAYGNVTAYSDKRLKDNIEIIPKALDKVMQLSGYTFTRTNAEKGDEDKRQTGVIAQEVLEVLPEAVSTDADGYHAVAYGNMVGLLIEAIKELKEEVEQLKKPWWKKIWEALR